MILIVDDEPPLSTLLATWIRQSGYEVATCADGREALEYLRSHAPPQLILLDLDMPGMDGWQFRHEQLLDPALAGIPTVIITASTGAPKWAQEVPGISVFPKPVDRERLLERVAAFCGPAPRH